MRNIGVAFIYLFIYFLLVSCSQNGNVVTEEDVVTLDMAAIDMPEELDENVLVTKKIIETSIYISVNNIEKAKAQLEKIIRDAKAEVSRENYSNDEIQTELYVPRKNYETAIEAFNENNFDIIHGKSTEITNITKSYYELKNQLNSDDILLAKYQELLKKSSAIEDVLTIYERIENLEREQRNRNDQMAYYNKMQNYNLVKVTIRKIDKGEVQQSFFKRTLNSLSNGITTLEEFFFGILNIWPILLIILLSIFGIKKYRSRKNKG